MSASGTSATSTDRPQSAHHDVREQPSKGVPHQAAAFSAALFRARGLPLTPHRPDEQPRDDVDDQRDDKEHEADLDQRMEVQRRRLASANSLAMTADIVYCGANSDALIFGLFPMTIVTAIVSPSARPNPSITAPTMPVRA